MITVIRRLLIALLEKAGGAFFARCISSISLRANGQILRGALLGRERWCASRVLYLSYTSHERARPPARSFQTWFVIKTKNDLAFTPLHFHVSSKTGRKTSQDINIRTIAKRLKYLPVRVRVRKVFFSFLFHITSNFLAQPLLPHTKS